MEDTANNKTQRLCGICDINLSKYCCPRCETFYCSLSCYKSEKHLDCSESFYRDCVNEELSSYHAGDEAKQKMLDILKRAQSDNVNDDLNDQLEEVDCVGDDIDSDDDVEIDLHERVKGLNLDDADALWNVLTEDERNEFEALIHGEVGSILPQWEPWWMYQKNEKLVEEVQSSDTVEEHFKKCPHLKTVPKFDVLTKIKPSPAIAFNIANVLSSYVFIMRYFNGDVEIREAVTHLMDICTNLNMNTNFEELDTAVESVAQRCLQSELIETDKTSLNVMRHDTFLILNGPSAKYKTYYCRAALSDLIEMFNQAKALPKGTNKDNNNTKKNKGRFSKKFPENTKEYLPNLDISKVKKNIKKLEFYLSFIESCDNNIEFI